MKGDFKILYVEDETEYRKSVLRLLGTYNDVEGAATFEEADALIRNKQYDVVILDKTLGERSGLDLIPLIKDESPNAVVIILTADSDFSKSVKKCMDAGADDYVVKSDNIISDLMVRMSIAVSRAAIDRKLDNLEKQIKHAFRYELIGKSLANTELRANILGLRGFGAHVLITGESGTGKELVARMINAVENDPHRPFEAMNCAAIPANLIESTLFGHKKGAFTGAISDEPGKFELAHGGDLFLDEIGELSLEAQSKLLRVLQEGEFNRVGGNKTIHISCRVIAATNRNLDLLVKKGLFREDLYYRLNVVRLRTTPLRDRLEDINDLAQFFLLRHGGPKLTLSESALKRLKNHDWPGNIRVLSNTIERAVISCLQRGASKVGLEDISIDSPLDSPDAGTRHITTLFPNDPLELSPENYRDFMETAEYEYLRQAVHLMKGNVTEAASVLDLGRSTMFRKLQELGVNRSTPGLRTNSSNCIDRNQSVQTQRSRV